MIGELGFPGEAADEKKVCFRTTWLQTGIQVAQNDRRAVGLAINQCSWFNTSFESMGYTLYRIIFSLLVPPITHLRRLAAYVSTTRVSPLTGYRQGTADPQPSETKSGRNRRLINFCKRGEIVAMKCHAHGIEFGKPSPTPKCNKSQRLIPRWKTHVMGTHRLGSCYSSAPRAHATCIRQLISRAAALANMVGLHHADG